MVQPSLVTRPWEMETFSTVSPLSLTRGVCRARRRGGRGVCGGGAVMISGKDAVTQEAFSAGY